MIVQVIIMVEVDNSIGNVSLFLGVVEDVVFYNVFNGEDEYYDVFCSIFNSFVNGMFVVVLVIVGELVVIDVMFSLDSDWDFECFYMMVILQEMELKVVIQVVVSLLIDNSLIVSIQDFVLLVVKVYLNLVKD